MERSSRSSNAMDGSTIPNSTRVLRAADVIPPFGNSQTSSSLPVDENGIPAFDLAESILAEQRRIATGKRTRARGARREGMGDSPPARPAVAAPAQPYDLAELHQIVAGIVSRDIERLCTGPSVAL
jgi:hypothetical protein